MFTKLKFFLFLDQNIEMGYWMYIRIALVALLVINIIKTIFFYSVKVLNRLRNYRKLWKNLFTFDLDDFTTSTNKRKLNLKGCSELEDLTNCKKKCCIEGGSSFYRWHVIQIFGLIFLAILLSTFFVYDEPPRKQNVDSVQKHRQEKEKDFLDMMIWKTGMTENVCEQTENRSYGLLAKSKRLQKKLRQQINQKEMKNVSVNKIAKMDPPSQKYSKCHAGETKKCLGSNPDDCSYLFNNFQDGRIFQGTFWIMVLVVEEENFDEVPRYIRIGNTRNFDRDRGNQRLAEIQNPGDIVPTVDLNLHRRNRLRSLVESSGFNSLSLRYDDHDDSSGIGNASVQHSDLQNREISMSYASGHPLRNTLSSGYQSGRRMHFSSGQHSFSLGSRIGEINEEANSNINHTSLNLESNGIDISENNANQFLFNSPLQEAVESENLPQQRALDMSNHQVPTNVRSTGIREFGGENIQSETSTITMHSTESKKRSNDHSELSVNTPSRNTILNPAPLMNSESHTTWQGHRNTSLNPTPLMNSELHIPSQCHRNTSLNPAPLMNSELHTRSQCHRNTNLNPTPLMNSESHTPWQCHWNTSLNPAPLMNSELNNPSQCHRNTSLNPAPLMNSESHTTPQCHRFASLSQTSLMNSMLQVSQFEKDCVPFVERFSQQLPASVTSNIENTPADAPIVAVSAANIQSNEPEIQSDLSRAHVNSHRVYRQRRNGMVEEFRLFATPVVPEDTFCLPDMDDIDEDNIFGDGSADFQELNENRKPGKDPDYKI